MKNEKGGETLIRASRHDYNYETHFHFINYRNNVRSIAKAHDIVLEEIGDNVVGPRAPWLALPDALAQELFNELWRVGYRPPREYEAHGGELDATARHLKDAVELRDEMWKLILGKCETGL